MTRDEILNMEAGREMDALIGKEVMGCDVSVNKHGVPFCQCRGGIHSSYSEEREVWPSLDCYSTDISAAYNVVDKFEIFNVESWREDGKSGACAIVNADLDLAVIADTAPLAICRAALLAVMK